MTDAAGCEPHRPSSRHWRRRLVQVEATAVRRSHSSCYYYYTLLNITHQTSSSSFLACNSSLRRAVRRTHPPQRPVLGHIHCVRQCEIVGSQILLYLAIRCGVVLVLIKNIKRAWWKIRW